MEVPWSVYGYLTTYFPNNLTSRLQFQKEEEEIRRLEKSSKKTKSQKTTKELQSSSKEVRMAGIHETTSLDEFLQYIKDPNPCGNVLDQMNIFIRLVIPILKQNVTNFLKVP